MAIPCGLFFTFAGVFLGWLDVLYMLLSVSSSLDSSSDVHLELLMYHLYSFFLFAGLYCLWRLLYELDEYTSSGDVDELLDHFKV